MAEPAQQPHFRVWTYAAPAVVLGCSQRSLLPAVAQRLPEGVELHARPSGGRRGLDRAVDGERLGGPAADAPLGARAFA